MATSINDRDPIQVIVGPIGRYQLLRICLVFFISIPGISHIFCSVFGMAKSDFGCWREETLNATEYDNSCINGTECPFVRFDTSFWTGTIISEYELVCEKSHLQVVAKLALFGGFACGTFGSGLTSDIFGRKVAIVLFSQILFASGILATIMPNIYAFIFIWFFVGFSAIGVYTVCIVWSMELASGMWKNIIGMTFGFAWPLGRLLVAGVAYWSRDWKILFQTFAGLHIATPILMNFVPESPRWLISSGKYQEALTVLSKISIKNGQISEELDFEMFMGILSECNLTQNRNKKQKKEKFWHIFQYPILRYRALVMYWNWFVASFIVYGLTLNWQTLTGNLFTNFIIGSALAIPGKFVAMAIVLKGQMRKFPIIVTMLVSSVAFFISLTFEKGRYAHDWPIVVCAMVGSTAMAVCFAILWVYTAELFPTNIRNAAVGSSSFMSRIGGVSANFVATLATLFQDLPVYLFATSALLATFLSAFLPETGNNYLPNTMDEVKIQMKNRKETLKHTERKCLKQYLLL